MELSKQGHTHHTWCIYDTRQSGNQNAVITSFPFRYQVLGTLVLWSFYHSPVIRLVPFSGQMRTFGSVSLVKHTPAQNTPFVPCSRWAPRPHGGLILGPPNSTLVNNLPPAEQCPASTLTPRRPNRGSAASANRWLATASKTKGRIYVSG